MILEFEGDASENVASIGQSRCLWDEADSKMRNEQKKLQQNKSPTNLRLARTVVVEPQIASSAVTLVVSDS